MGEIAAQTLLNRLRQGNGSTREVAVEPELVIRESTTNRLRPSGSSKRDEAPTTLTTSAQ